jgi:aspartyl-tRNA(Asn)/glutamyl-tRNA(Gln) amidotransferase subunit B
MRSPQEAYAYLTALKSVLEYVDVSDCNMEEGSLRCDANISIRPLGQKEFGTKAEVKNMNSFKAVQKALEYEINRQIKAVEEGERIVQETRLWDADKEMTFSMRSKEEAHDYRYFPEPDLVPVTVDDAWLAEIKKTLPELSAQKKERFIKEYNLPEYDAGVLTADRAVSEYFENTVKGYANPKAASNWIMVELMAQLNVANKTIIESKITPAHLRAMLELMDKGTISGKIAKTVFEEMFVSGKMPDIVVKEKGLVQISDEGAIAKVIEEVLAANAKSVEEYKAGKTAAMNFLLGQVMKKTQGKANPGVVNKILKEKLR